MAHLSIDPSKTLNLETPRVPTLFPDQIRESAQTIMDLLQDYYDYLNSDGLPSNILVETLSENDIDEVSAQFLNNLQSAIAVYVPLPFRHTYYSRVALYKKIVKYYYNTRGSRESVDVFFRMMFGEIIEMIDIKDARMLSYIQDWLNNDVKAVDAWKNYCYGIYVSIGEDQFGASYRAMVHPIGFKYFAILRLILVATNAWAEDAANFNTLRWSYTKFDPTNGRGDSLNHTIPVDFSGYPKYDQLRIPLCGGRLIQIPCVPAGHSPYYQPDTITFGGSEEEFAVRIQASLDVPLGRMWDARYDYQNALKFWDTTAIGNYANYIISDADKTYDGGQRTTTTYAWAEWSNVGTVMQYSYYRPNTDIGMRRDNTTAAAIMQIDCKDETLFQELTNKIALVGNSIKYVPTSGSTISGIITSTSRDPGSTRILIYTDTTTSAANYGGTMTISAHPMILNSKPV